MADDDERRVDLDTILDHLQEEVGELMDVNHKLARRMRTRADKFFGLSLRMEDLAKQYREVGQLCIDMAYEHALFTSDTIAAEYAVPLEEMDDEEEDDE